MPLDIYSTYYMQGAIEVTPRESAFFLNRYFPTDPETDIFNSSKVLVDYRENGRKMAPFVVPRVGNIPMLREGFETYEYEPANIAPALPLSIDELTQRGFGEALFSNRTAADRAKGLLLKDMRMLRESILRRLDWLAAQTILNNGCVMQHIGDDKTKSKAFEVRYYSEDSNPAVYVVATPWDDGGDYRKDIKAAARLLKKRGIAVTELVAGTALVEHILRDEETRKLLDTNNYNIGKIDPKDLDEFTTYVGRINFDGLWLDVYENTSEYVDDDGNTHLLLPPDEGILLAPKCGHAMFGSVTLFSEAGVPVTHTGQFVPDYYVDRDSQTRELRMNCKPLLAPNTKSPWMRIKGAMKGS